jgi:hypothetical protein
MVSEARPLSHGLHTAEGSRSSAALYAVSCIPLYHEALPPQGERGSWTGQHWASLHWDCVLSSLQPGHLTGEIPTSSR